MNLARILELREEKAQLMEVLRTTGRHGLGAPAKNAAMRRVAEINGEIREIEYQTETVANPLDTMTIDELREKYEADRSAYLKTGGRDTRTQAALAGISTRIQRLEAEQAEKGGSN